MDFKLIDNKLIVYVSGRVDSNTSNKVEEEITSIINSNPSTSVELDFENVEFLSSAGLRVILRLKKKVDNLCITNVVPEVYEIFEMTGFNEMMDIQKGFRKISVEDAEEIGRGANGIVYRYADDMIVKVYFNNAALDEIKNEIRLAKKAFVSGISTAIPFDIVKVGPYYGSVFEMIKAESISKLINENPEKIDDYIALFIDLLKTMNSTIVNDESIPAIKDKAISWIDYIKNEIPEESVKKLYKLFEGIKEDNFMIHRDFHIKNLLMQQDELILIDMDTLSRGNVIFELTGLYNAYIGFTTLTDDDKEPFLGIPHETSFYIWKRILELYFPDKNKKELKEIETKISLISSVQLLRVHMKRINLVPHKMKKEIAILKERIAKILPLVDDLNI